MSQTLVTSNTDDGIIYPESDGKPMADNTRQFRYIVLIKEGLEVQFKKDPLVFVGGDLLWYPVKGNWKLCTAPDAMVVLGRPKGDRGSYMQWLEDNQPPQVTFEVLSPSNSKREMNKKRGFYQQYGVQEYYLYDPDNGRLEGWQAVNGQFIAIENMRGWKSPLLGIRFELDGIDLKLYHPDEAPFVDMVELSDQLEQATRQALKATGQAERERNVRQHAQNQAEQERLAKERAWTKLRELGIDPEKLL